MDKGTDRPSTVTLAQILLVVSVAESILTFVLILLRHDATSHLPAVTWAQNIGFWIAWIALVVLLGRRQSWARIGVLALLAWNIRNFTLILLMRPAGAPPTWLLSQLPVFVGVQAVGLVALCIVFWTSWQRGRRIATFWLWIAVGVCSLPVSARDWRSLQIVFSLTTLRLCGAFLLFKKESNRWFRASATLVRNGGFTEVTTQKIMRPLSCDSEHD